MYYCCAENNRWEENRLMTSGVVRTTGVQTDFSKEETEHKVHIYTHEYTPVFLRKEDGSSAVQLAKQEVVSVVKDPTSGLACSPCFLHSSLDCT
jgi:pre-mRNA-splicing factor ATP-dependent RNA helicase DHX38/PRP16